MLNRLEQPTLPGTSMFAKTLIIAAFASMLANSAATPNISTTSPPVTLPIIQETTLAPILSPETPKMSALPRPRTFRVEAGPRRRWIVATAYSSTPDQTDDTPFTTASGTIVRDGIVAANWLPIGAYVRLPEIYGEKVFVVEDRMHPRFYERLDIWMPTREAAKNFGVKRVLVEVL